MRAVVLGAGIAGMCAAAALDAAGADVVMVERDDLKADRRPGAPQARQLHNLLGRAQLHLERLFPGFGRRLLALGGNRADVAGETHVYELGVRMPEVSCGLHLMSAPRPLIDRALRELLPRTVELRDRTRVLGLELTDGRVGGVMTGSGVCTADLVVDAMGASSPVTDWLAGAGAEVPDVDVVEVRQWYCTAVVHRPAGSLADPSFYLTFPSATGTRGGLLSPFGETQWYASLSGVARDPAPRTWTEFVAYARSLEDPLIGEVLADAIPVVDPHTFGRPKATWRRYDRITDPVVGLLPIGDAISALNPLLGQGISVAAWQADELRTAVRNGGTSAAATVAYLRTSGAAARAAWSLTGIFGTNASEGGLSADDWGRVAHSVMHNSDMHRRYVSVWHLLEPTTVLADIARDAREGS